MMREPRQPFRSPTTEYHSQRLTDLESLILWARSLLTVAKHETMKDALRLVMTELEERIQLLIQQGTDSAPTIGMTVDLTTTRARWRLKVIADAFERVGSGAPFNPATWP
jgi:hypothetical protein